MISFIGDVLKGILVAIALFAATNAITLATGWSNPRYVSLAVQIRKVAKSAGSRALFTADHGEITATVYDGATDTEKDVPLFYTQLPLLFAMTAKNGRFSSTTLYRRATYDVGLRLVGLTLITIPLVMLGLWLSIEVDHRWWYAIVLFAISYAATLDTGQIVFFKAFGPFAVIATVEILHRVTSWSLFSAETIFHINAVILIIFVAGYWFATRSEFASE